MTQWKFPKPKFGGKEGLIIMNCCLLANEMWLTVRPYAYLFNTPAKLMKLMFLQIEIDFAGLFVYIELDHTTET